MENRARIIVGVPPRLRDKREIIMAELLQNPGRSNRAIAAKLDIGGRSVASVRALAFALLVESTMLLAETSYISMAALVLLVSINSTSSAVHILNESN